MQFAHAKYGGNTTGYHVDEEVDGPMSEASWSLIKPHEIPLVAIFTYFGSSVATMLVLEALSLHRPDRIIETSQMGCQLWGGGIHKCAVLDPWQNM